jgi:hypothetical protein
VKHLPFELSAFYKNRGYGSERFLSQFKADVRYIPQLLQMQRLFHRGQQLYLAGTAAAEDVGVEYL